MSLNKVILIGHVGKDPAVKYFDSGNAVANFTLATNERGYTLANGTEVPERTEWHNIVVTRDRVQFVEKYVKKGSGVYVEGKIRSRNYDDPNGVKHYVTEIYADRIEFFSFGKKQDAADENSGNSSSSNVQPQPQPQSHSQQPQPLAVAEPSMSPEPTDDLPF
ncbi:MAG: single-stranded DNA-binding protein [Tannerella sp.]|jgi:single-strand DNA-binding protein|nr:single-stranded DNA-binding protein [Tannerella sp.]